MANKKKSINLESKGLTKLFGMAPEVNAREWYEEKKREAAREDTLIDASIFLSFHC